MDIKKIVIPVVSVIVLGAIAAVVYFSNPANKPIEAYSFVAATDIKAALDELGLIYTDNMNMENGSRNIYCQQTNVSNQDEVIFLFDYNEYKSVDKATQEYNKLIDKIKAYDEVQLVTGEYIYKNDSETDKAYCIMRGEFDPSKIQSVTEVISEIFGVSTPTYYYEVVYRDGSKMIHMLVYNEKYIHYIEDICNKLELPLCE